MKQDESVPWKSSKTTHSIELLRAFDRDQNKRHKTAMQSFGLFFIYKKDDYFRHHVLANGKF